MYLSVCGVNCNYLLTVNSCLNVILGDSSTGKTELIKRLRKRSGLTITTDASKLILSVDAWALDSLPSNSLVLLDIDAIYDSELLGGIANFKRNDVYFVLMGRKNIRDLPLSVSNTFKLINVKGVTKNIPFIEYDLIKYDYFDKVIVEDSKSGFKFFNEVFKNTHTSNGNSNIIKDVSEGNLLIFDSIGFGGYIEEFIEKAHSRSKIAYLGYESFEYFLLETLFKSTDIDNAINLEDSVVRAVKTFNESYSKKIGCTGDACNKCSQTCKQSSLSLFKKSKYSKFLDYEVTEEKDTIEEILDSLDFKGNREKIRKCLPIAEMSYDELYQAIKSAISFYE